MSPNFPEQGFGVSAETKPKAITVTVTFEVWMQGNLLHAKIRMFSPCSN